jgi:hypothetical protein
MDQAHIACSREQRELLEPVINRLNAHGTIKFTAHYYPDKDLIQYVVYRDFGIAFPRSALALYEIEDRWEERHGSLEHSLFAKTVACGVSPVVFFMSPQRAKQFGVQNKPFGWRALLKGIRKDELRVRHASMREQDGAAVAVAGHLAFAGGNTPPEEVAADLKCLEQGVDEYGPDDGEVLTRATADGDWATDVVIAQERSILKIARAEPGMKGVIVYPHDGTLAIPAIAGSVAGWNRPGHEQAFQLLATSLANLPSPALASSGLHKEAGSLSATGSVSPQTQSTVRWAAHAGGTLLVLPGRRAVRGIRNLAIAAKRSVDVCLLFDSSSSMAEQGKFAQAQSAIDTFLALLAGTQSRACVIRFQSTATVVTPLQRPSQPFYPTNALTPGGKTALLDAVELALDELEASADPVHIWAVVAFTDGLENSSQASLSELEERLRKSGRTRFYGVAYGADADIAPLASLANVTGGMAQRGDQATIQALYDRLATYV